jgi:hypothetical protein
LDRNGKDGFDGRLGRLDGDGSRGKAVANGGLERVVFRSKEVVDGGGNALGKIFDVGCGCFYVLDRFIPRPGEVGFNLVEDRLGGCGSRIVSLRLKNRKDGVVVGLNWHDVRHRSP